MSPEQPMESQKPNQNIPPIPPASLSQGPIISAKPKLSNSESILLIIFALLVLISLGGNNSNQNILAKVQFFLIWIWLIIGIGLFYKNFNLFGGELPKDEGSQLTTKEKTLIWIFSIINPSIVGLLTLFLWHKKNPPKARRATIITMIVFLIEFIIGLSIGLLLAKTGNL